MSPSIFSYWFLPRSTCAHTHTYTNTHHHPSSPCQAEEAERGRAWAFRDLAFFIFLKAWVGPWSAWLTGRIWYLAWFSHSLSSARLSPTHHGPDQMPLCILLVAKYTQGTIPKVVVHLMGGRVVHIHEQEHNRLGSLDLNSWKIHFKKASMRSRHIWEIKSKHYLRKTRTT